MTKHEIDVLCKAVIADESKNSGFQANAFTGRLSDIIQWLRANGVTLMVVLSNFRNIWDIINLPDPPNTWIVKFQKIVELFWQPADRPQIEFPSWAS